MCHLPSVAGWTGEIEAPKDCPVIDGASPGRRASLKLTFEAFALPFLASSPLFLGEAVFPYFHAIVQGGTVSICRVGPHVPLCLLSPC